MYLDLCLHKQAIKKDTKEAENFDCFLSNLIKQVFRVAFHLTLKHNLHICTSHLVNSKGSL